MNAQLVCVLFLQFGRCVRMSIHHVRQDVPVFIVFRALGVISDQDIVRHVAPDMTDPVSELLIRELAGCMDEASSVRTQARVSFRLSGRIWPWHAHPQMLAPV